MKSNTFSCLLLLCLLASHAVKAGEEFIVKDIQVKGLQRISAGTVYNDFPVNVGERFSLDNVFCRQSKLYLRPVFFRMCHFPEKVLR
jgi:outer membrane protein insertion porin family